MASAGHGKGKMQAVESSGPKEMLHMVLHMGSKHMIKITAMVWTWWKTRNKINAGQVLKIGEVVAMVGRCAVKYEELYLPPPTTNRAVEQKLKPPVTVVGKINCNGAFDPNNDVAVSGVLLSETLKGTVLGATHFISTGQLMLYC